MTTPAAPTQYNHFVSMAVASGPAAPYVFTTSESADATCRLCAISYAEQQQKEKPLSHKMWIKFEEEHVDAVDRYLDEARYICEWNETARAAVVSKLERVRDGTFRSGYVTVTELAMFAVNTVPRFISPLKVKQYFEKRASEQAAAKAAAEKKAAEETLAKLMEAAAVTVTGLPVAPMAAPAPSPAVVAPAPAPAVPTPSFNDVFKNFTQ
jgi:hypothetical protein